MTRDQASTPKADILIVDDTPHNIRFLSAMLMEQGYNVRKALDGQMALTAVETVAPDLILLDINMPGMNGYEVCKRLKENPQTSAIPIIFLSALDDVVDKVRGFQLGASDYITKPFQFEEVLVRLQTQLTIRALQTQLETQNEQLQQALSNLKSAQTQLVQKEKMIGLGQLVAGVAHEINNPISFISGNLAPARRYIQDLFDLITLYQQEYPLPTPRIQKAIETIDLNFLTADLQKLIGSMQNGVERIRNVILALRIFSRLDESDIKTVNIHEGIESTLVLLQHRLNASEHRREIQVIRNYGKLPLINCYASQVNQVFLNLLNNAIDALSLGSGELIESPSNPTIWITTETTLSNSIIIRIKDNGVGIPESVRSRLFDPFFTTKPVGEGMGLGLSTSYQIIVERHQGRLTCQSLAGQGAEFIVEIPIYLSAAMLRK
jgi:signal transduction histidine kinase